MSQTYNRVMNRENWLKFSLLSNLVLAVVIGILVTRSPKSQPLPTVSNAANESPTRTDGGFTRQPNPSPVFKARGGDWRNWIGDLRAAGVPDNVIAGLVVSQFEENWQKRVDELQKQIDNGDADPDAFQQLAREHDDAEADEVRAALGESGYRNWDMGNLMRNLNLKDIAVTGAETNELYDLEKNLHNRQRQLDEQRQKGEIDDAAYADATGKAQEEFNQKLKGILGDERFATMQGGTGEDASLKRDLKKLNASDDQFASMLQAQRDWMKQRTDLENGSGTNLSSAAVQQQLQAIDAARDQEYQRVLGTNAFDALQMERDASYSQMKKYQSAWGINDADVNYAYQTLRYYEQSVQNYQQQEQALEQQGQTVNWDAVNKNLQQFSQQTEQTLRNYFGDDRYNQIQRNGVFPFGANAPSPDTPVHAPPGH